MRKIYRVSPAAEATFERQFEAWEKSRFPEVNALEEDPELPAGSIFEALGLLSRESSDYLDALEKAYQLARSAEEARLACAVSMVAAVIDHGTMARLHVWLERLPASSEGRTVNSVTDVWLALGHVAAAVLYRARVDESQAADAANRLFRLLNSSSRTVSADTMVVAAQLLLEYGFAVGRFELLDLVISLVEGPGVMSLATPVARARWFSCRGYLCFMRADADGAKRCWRQAQAISEGAQLRGASFMAQLGLARQLLDEQDTEGADATLATLRPAEGPGRSTQVLVYKHAVARSLLMKAQPNAALMQIEEALDAARLLGIVDGELFLLMQQKAEILFALGQHVEALRQIEWMIERSQDTDRRIHGINFHLLQALGPQADSPEKRVESLRQAFGDARAWNFTRFLRSLPGVASQACLDALRAGVEVSFVTDTIRQRRLRAPPNAGSHWPWLVVVATLGHAGVTIQGQPLKFPGRTQAKPLELLFFLASARGMRASNEVIATQLWPDEDLDRAQKSLETTTARLRKALGDASLIQVAQNQSALDSGRVWADWHGLASVAARLSAAANGSPRGDGVDVAALADELLAVYQGEFLASTGDVPWVLARRREATQMFVAAAIAVHAAWPINGVSRPVETFLESALVQDPLSETVALALMKLYARSDRPADALRVFRRLRHQMSVLLGIKTGKAIEAFAQDLLAREF